MKEPQRTKQLNRTKCTMESGKMRKWENTGIYLTRLRLNANETFVKTQ